MAINIVNFSVVNIVNGYYFLTITGLVIFIRSNILIKFFNKT